MNVNEISDVIKFIKGGKLNGHQKFEKIIIQHIYNKFTRMSVDVLCDKYINGEQEVREFIKENRFVTTPILIGYYQTHRQELTKAPDFIKQEIEEYQKKNFKKYDKPLNSNLV